MLSRNQEQDLLMKLIYAYLMEEDYILDEDIIKFIEDMTEETYSEVSIFIKETFIKFLKHKEELINEIVPHLKRKITKMNKVTLAIILLGLTECKYIEDTSKAPVIDVCIELSKKYCDYNDYRFVNSILDKMIENGK